MRWSQVNNTLAYGVIITALDGVDLQHNIQFTDSDKQKMMLQCIYLTTQIYSSQLKFC